eukprot:GHVR01038744.1.p1 GENE.GHVR01038744.1~~GHVR01038744.1.p1  ORF type:complete len:221 (-),score=28.59 GHVR01038744.1:283-945(-)
MYTITTTLPPPECSPRVDTRECDKINTCLYLTAIVDGDLGKRGQPKALELFTACPIDDLSLYGINVNNSGYTPPGSPPDWNFPSISASGGSFIWVTKSANDVFDPYFGFEVTSSAYIVYNVGELNFNGDDAVQLLREYNNNNQITYSVVDSYGVTGEDPLPDGNWLYINSFATRYPGTYPNSVGGFEVNDWNIRPVGTLEEESDASKINTMSYDCSPLQG